MPQDFQRRLLPSAEICKTKKKIKKNKKKGVFLVFTQYIQVDQIYKNKNVRKKNKNKNQK